MVERKLGKVEQEIYNLLPFLLSCIVFPREYFRDTRALPLSFEPLSLFRKGWLRLKWRPDGILAERLFRDGDPAGPVAPENIPLTSWIELQGRILAPVQFSS